MKSSARQIIGMFAPLVVNVGIGIALGILISMIGPGLPDLRNLTANEKTGLTFPR